MIDVWIIEDNEDFRNAVRLAIERTDNIRCSHAFPNCEEALAQLERISPPQVILLDINLPGLKGTEGVKEIKIRAKATQVVMLTTFDDHSSIFQALCGGATGYILKTDGISAILQSILGVVNGGAPMSPPIARSVLNLFSRHAAVESAYGLSSREKEVLALLVEGLSKKEASAKLDLSIHTVDNHIRSIYDKLHVHSRSAAVAKAIKERLF